LNQDLSMQIAAWLQGIGTVAAVVLALFLQVFLVWLRRPKVRLEVSLDIRDQDLVTASRPEREHYVCWLRARIFVSGRTHSAINAEVVVQDWRSPADQGAPFAHGNSLRWANSRDELVRIPSGTWRRFDLICWMASSTVAAEPLLWIALRHAKTYPPPSWFQLREAGIYEIDLMVVADNMKPSRWSFRFTYNPAMVENLDDLRDAVKDVELVRK
jgi:hypothetical protein